LSVGIVNEKLFKLFWDFRDVAYHDESKLFTILSVVFVWFKLPAKNTSIGGWREVDRAWDIVPDIVPNVI